MTFPSPRKPFNFLTGDNHAQFCRTLSVKGGSDHTSLYAIDRGIHHNGRIFCFLICTCVTLSNGKCASYVFLANELAETPPGGVILTMNKIFSHRTLLRMCGVNLPHVTLRR